MTSGERTEDRFIFIDDQGKYAAGPGGKAYWLAGRAKAEVEAEKWGLMPVDAGLFDAFLDEFRRTGDL